MINPLCFLLALAVAVSNFQLAHSVNDKEARRAKASLTNEGLRNAVDLWLEDPEAAEREYGPIGEWDTSEVTNLDSLFQNQANFDEDISNWDVKRVTSMQYSFAACTYFNSPLNNW